jgi:cation transport ATPase
MSWLSEIFSSSASAIVDSVGNAIDKLVTSDEERLAMKNELVKIQLEATLKANEQANEAEAQITERWKSDNEHLITRLVRPLSFAWVIVLFSVVIMGDSNWGFSVKDTYIPVLETLLVTMVISYFGSRGFEKVSSIVKGK